MPSVRRAELDSINTEADWATALYVAGIVLFATGAISGIVLTVLHYPVCANVDRVGCIDRDQVGAAASFAASGLGLVLTAIAYGLDRDSGSQRRALGPRRPRGPELTSVSVAPTEGGAALQLGGRF